MVDALAGRRPAVTAPGPAGAWRGTGGRAVALTFDDGPDPVNTPRLLDVLRRNRVRATFCLVGSRVVQHPAVVARIAAEGHTLCNHSWQHKQTLFRESDDAIRADLHRTSTAIRRAAPGAPVRWFRAPYGNFNPNVNRVAERLGMTPIFWDVDDQSYASGTYGTGAGMVAHMVRLVREGVRPGSIVLSHDMLKPWTVTAYERLLPRLRHRFRLAALPDDGGRPDRDGPRGRGDGPRGRAGERERRVSPASGR
ncbi:hypothetical protein GCM10010123_39220 [Pilimelia anulata]|uniref:NodB homology domain-containing protein n=2 Tax=Pilimelia anulata TaxID=53371 RepID=A0A8J3B9I1_9ACTN|nr:hypothetical protein GCM10010123_39220 [Pilimelia anulata]